MQIPYTPTPWPEPFSNPNAFGQGPLINLPSGYTVWGFADDTVGVWNRMGSTNTQAIQIALLLVIVFLSVYFIVRLVRSLSSESSST